MSFVEQSQTLLCIFLNPVSVMCWSSNHQITQFYSYSCPLCSQLIVSAVKRKCKQFAKAKLRDKTALNCTYFYDGISKLDALLLDFILIDSSPLFCLNAYRFACFNINTSYLHDFEIFSNVADAPVHLKSFRKKSSVQFFSLNCSLIVCEQSRCFLQMSFC